MRIAVVCNDTRGGIQPYVALALGLKRAGHEVRCVAPSDFRSMFEGVGLPMASLSGSIEAFLRGSNGAAEKGTLSSMRLAAREMPMRMATWTKETLAACEGVDVLTGGIGGLVVGLAVAEKLGKPFIETHLQPVHAPTSEYPGVLFPRAPRWAWRLSHALSELAIFKPFEGAMAKARREVLGLRGSPKPAQGPLIYGFSRHVVAVPQDEKRPRHVVGYWTLPAPSDFVPPPALASFLARPGPVVSIGFGSMSSAAPEKTTELVLNAVRAAGVRAVLVSGWGGMTSVQDSDVYCADSLPYDWLFPKMSAVVHHGGAGTTGSGFLAGVPAIVVPFMMDQPFWGSRVEQLGTGPKPIPRLKLSSSNLAEALKKTVENEAMRKRAASLGALIRAEDSVTSAVTALEASV